MIRRPPTSTRTDTLCPCTTLCRSPITATLSLAVHIFCLFSVKSDSWRSTRHVLMDNLLVDQVSDIGFDKAEAAQDVAAVLANMRGASLNADDSFRRDRAGPDDLRLGLVRSGERRTDRRRVGKEL